MRGTGRRDKIVHPRNKGFPHVEPRPTLAFAIAVVIVAAACGGSRSDPELTPSGSAASAAEGSGRRRGCATIDSVFLKWAPVYAECEVDMPAKPIGRPIPPNFTPQRGDPVTCYRAQFDYVIDAGGKPIPESVKILRQTSSVFTQAVVSAVMSDHYTPARKGDANVAQIKRYDLSLQRTAVAAGRPQSSPMMRPGC